MTIHRYFTAAVTISALMLLVFAYIKYSRAPDLAAEPFSNDFSFEHSQNIASASADFALPYGDEVTHLEATNKNKINTVKYDKSLFNVTGTVAGEAGNESALISYNGNNTGLYKAGEELFDGLVIQKINKSEVVLKNQINEEVFSVYIAHQDSSSNSAMKDWDEERKFQHPVEKNYGVSLEANSTFSENNIINNNSSLKASSGRKVFQNPEKFFLDSELTQKTDGAQKPDHANDYRLMPLQSRYFMNP